MHRELPCSYSTISAKALLDEVVSDYCVKSPQDCIFWERGANDTYRVRCTDAYYSLRVYRCDAFPREAIAFEAEALSYLHDQDFTVAYPIARKSGGYLTEIAAPEGPRFVLLTSFADGEPPDYESLENSRLVGESVAQMHLLSDGFKTSRERTHLDLQSLLEDSMTAIRPLVAHRPDDLKAIENIAQEARASVQAVPENLLDTGFCHGDFHGYNLHLHEGKVTHFDFEECAYGYRVYDLATFRWGVCMGEQRAKRWSAFIEGFASIRPIAKSDLSLVGTFVVIRELSNIAFGIRNLKDFGHELSSESNIEDVRRQLEKIQTLIDK